MLPCVLWEKKQLGGIGLAMVTHSQCSGLEHSDTGVQETPLPIAALHFSSRFFHCELIRAGCMTLEVSPSPTAEPSLDWVPQENEFSLLTHICDNRCAGPTARSHCSFPFAGHSSFLWGLNFLGLFFFLLF